MDRRSPLAAALAAMAVLALASPNARADAEAAAAESTATITAEPAPAPSEAGPPQGSLQDLTPTSAADSGASAEVLLASPTPEPTNSAPPAAPPLDLAPPPDPPAPPDPPEAAAPQRPAAADGLTDASSSGPAVSEPLPAGPARGAPAPSGGAAAAVESPTGPSLERILPAVERDLRKVQADVDAIRRQLDRGATPPAIHLNRLRSRLEQLAPVLLALDVRVDAAGAPGEQARQLLHRVRGELAETQVSTAGLIAALLRSDLHGPDLRALLRELEGFGALGSARDLGPTLDLGPGATAFAPTPQAIDTAAPAAVAPAYTSGDSPNRPGVSRPKADDAPKAAGQHAPEPWPSAPGSATASPGGALSVAGLALLAALVFALSLPRLLACLELRPGRGHAVASVLALERPG